ncbi:hypothetical protein FL583_31740 [Cryptosporangium phraense]|uniref:MobA-like NTP transferase domain-containing protein n=1 Tax=Cryptosporangium phraense TaxID=2593070 RepID=A0A545AI83_9ACTN|nr:hypothetical protein FL583_31740 [Cryptosporangium phraense]
MVLAGGQARRLGGVHKPGLLIAGVSLLDRVLAAVADAAPRLVVGPPQPAPADVLVVRENPPGGGPVAALAAGLNALVDVSQQPITWLALLAGDLPFLTPAVVSSLRAAAASTDGAVLVDGSGRDQYLAGVYRLSSLAGAVSEQGTPGGAPLRRVIGRLSLARVTAAPGGAPPWLDCDDADDVRIAETLARETSESKEADG